MPRVSPTALDHAFYLVRSLDAWAPAFGSLGFALEPEAELDLGIANRLMMFSDTYLELAAARGDTAFAHMVTQLVARRDSHLAGVMLRVADVDRASEWLRSRGHAAGAVQRYSRALPASAGNGRVSFSTVQATPGVLPGLHVVLIQHHTPELVWHTRRAPHPNSAANLEGITVVAPDPRAAAREYAAVLEAEVSQTPRGDACVRLARGAFTFVSAATCIERFGEDAAQPPHDLDAFAGAVQIGVTSVGKVTEALAASGITHRRIDERTVAVPAAVAAGAALEFVQSER